MIQYESIPAGSTEITEEQFHHEMNGIGAPAVEKTELRDIGIRNGPHAGEKAGLLTFWMDSVRGLGYAHVTDHPNHMVSFYRIGTREDWTRFIADIDARAC